MLRVDKRKILNVCWTKWLECRCHYKMFLKLYSNLARIVALTDESFCMALDCSWNNIKWSRGKFDLSKESTVGGTNFKLKAQQVDDSVQTY